MTESAAHRVVNHEFRPTRRQWEAMQAMRMPQTDKDWLAMDKEEGSIELLFGGGKGGGKLLDISTPLCTPDGWVTMGDMRVGMLVYSADGTPTVVVGVSEIDTDPDAMEVVFDTGETIIADARHLWHTWTLAERKQLVRRSEAYRSARRACRASRGTGAKPWLAERNRVVRPTVMQPPTGSIRTTAEIMSTLRAGGKLNAVNHAIEATLPLCGVETDLPIPPYLLGLWLADGCSQSGIIGKMDIDLAVMLSHVAWPVRSRKADKRKKQPYSVVRFEGLTRVLREAALIGDKHIPPAYLRASYKQRLALLQGIMDGDGTVDTDGHCEITQVRKRLIGEIAELVGTFGIIAVVHEGRATLDGRDYGPKYRLQWTTPIPMFRLPRKLNRQKRTGLRASTHRRFIVDVRPIAKRPMRCIQVAHPSGMYLCGKGMIPTHNSHWLCEMMYYYALEVARYFELPVVPPTQNVPHIGWIGRKVAQVFVQTTLQTWQTVIPTECYRLVAASEKQPRHIRIANRVAIDYGGLDNRADLERFNSAQYAVVGVDQAEETVPDDVSTLRASRRLRLMHPKHKHLVSLPFRGLWTANPRQGWLKQAFIDQRLPRHVFIPALHADNPYLPVGYVQTLQDSFSHRPDLIKAYLEGDWHGLSAVDQIILDSWITAAKVRYGRHPYIKRWVSIDPARFGDDSCVILGGENTEIIDGRVLPYSPEPQIVVEAEAMARRLGDCERDKIPIVVETVGVCGVGDYLREHGFVVIEHQPAAAASDTDTWYNLRAEVWSTVARWFSDGVYDTRCGAVVSLPQPVDSEIAAIWSRVCDQLQWPSYDFRGQKVLVSAKEDIKKDHSGVSPDYADAYVNGLFYLPRMKAMTGSDLEHRAEFERRRRGPVKHRMGF